MKKSQRKAASKDALRDREITWHSGKDDGVRGYKLIGQARDITDCGVVAGLRGSHKRQIAILKSDAECIIDVPFELIED